MTIRNSVLVIAAALLAVGGWYVVSNKSPATQTGPLTIGFMGSLTGDAAAYGEPQRNAVELAVKEINSKGGIDGRLVQVVYEDDGCSGTGGASAAQKLVNINHVQVILGGTCSNATLTALPIVTADKVAMVTGSATSPDLIDKSAYFFRTFPNDSQQGVTLADGAFVGKHYQTAAIIAEETPYALGVAKAFSTRFSADGGTVVGMEQFTSDTTDFHSIILKIRAEKADSVLISAQTNANASRILSQMRGIGWKPHLLVNDIVIADAPTVSQNAAEMEGALGATFVLPDSAKLTAFRSAYTAAYGGTSVPYENYTSAVYDSVYLVADAIKAVGYDGTKIAAWARTHVKDWQGASGSITIGANGERESGFSLLTVHNGNATPITQ
ncbi:MAG: ABC transporter substrate-binding protein [Patescibacteria group bacterium]|nr:ABC transporter substrate-binding protein [Patescibacteria group bacterium]